MSIKCVLGHKLGEMKNVRRKEDGMFGVLRLWGGENPETLIYDAACTRCGINFSKKFTVPGGIVGYYDICVSRSYDSGKEQGKLELKKGKK